MNDSPDVFALAKGLRVLLTAGASGIGRAISDLLALRGARINPLPGSAPLEASFAIADDGQAKLTITTNIDAPSGRWKGAVCGEDDEQIGLIEIEL